MIDTLMYHSAYIGLGGNIGDAIATLFTAVELLSHHHQISSCTPSRFYRTTPVSSIAQEHYINAVCRITTCLVPHQLLYLLQKIETQLGKTAKAKEAPRIIDIDLLFYGSERYDDSELTIPHPRWHERLFVLLPLRELTDFAPIVEKNLLRWLCLDQLIATFSNPHNEVVIPITYT